MIYELHDSRRQLFVDVKKGELERLYILAELFNMCLKKPCIPDCWNPCNVAEKSIAENYRPVSLLSIVGKVFEKLVNNRLINHLEQCDLFFFLIFNMVLGLLDQCPISELVQLSYISCRWCKLNFGPLGVHVELCHFPERIDMRRQYFYFYTIFLG